VHLVLDCLSLSHIAEVEESRSAKVSRAFCPLFVSSSKTSPLFRLEGVIGVIGRAFCIGSIGKAFNTQHPQMDVTDGSNALSSSIHLSLAA
jgi:hypothetical protein